MSHEFLATWIGDLFAASSNLENRVFCTMRVIFRAVFKNFSFFPRLLWLFIVSLFQTHRVYSQNLHFLHHLFTNLQEQGIGYLIFSKYFMFLAFHFLDFLFLLSFENMMSEYGLGIFCWVCYLGFVGFGCMLPTIHVLHACFSFLSSMSCLCCVVISCSL